MIKRHAFPIAVLILAIISLSIPESRRVMTLQVRYLATKWWVYPTEILAHEGLPRDLLRIAQNPGTIMDEPWQADIARAQICRAKDSDQHLRSALRTGHDRPEVYAAAITGFLKETWWRRAEVADPRYPEEPLALDASLGREILQLCTRGSELDPDNAFFDLTAASVLFGMHRDAEALERFHHAAAKPGYDTYRRAIAGIVEEYFHRSGMLGLESEMARWQASHSYTRRLKSSAELVVYHARVADANGRHREAENLAWDVLKAGVLVRSYATDMNEFGGGIALQTAVSGLDPAYMDAHPAPAKLDSLAGRSFKYRRISGMMRSHGWSDMASYWEAQAAYAESFYRKRQALPTYQPAVNTASKALCVTFLSSHLLQVTLILLVVALLAWIALRFIAPLPSEQYSRHERGVTVLSLAAWWSVMLVSLFPHYNDWLGIWIDDLLSPVGIATVGIVGVLWPVLIWSFLRQKRSMPLTGEPGRLVRLGLLASTLMLFPLSGAFVYSAWIGGMEWLEYADPTYFMLVLVLVLFTHFGVILRACRGEHPNLLQYALHKLSLNSLVTAKAFAVMYFILLFVTVFLRVQAVDQLQAETAREIHLIKTYGR